MKRETRFGSLLSTIPSVTPLSLPLFLSVSLAHSSHPLRIYILKGLVMRLKDYEGKVLVSARLPNRNKCLMCGEVDLYTL